MAITVLYIEDNFWNYDSLKLYLEVEHKIYIEEWVDNVEKAVKALKKRDFDYILIDMELHGNKKAGIEVIKAIKNLTKGYLVVLSGSGLDDRVYEAYENGAHAYEYKLHNSKIPIVFDELARGCYVQMYYIAGEKKNQLNEEQKKITEDLKNKLSIKDISKKHKKSYKATSSQISRIKKKFGVAWDYIFGKN